MDTVISCGTFRVRGVRRSADRHEEARIRYACAVGSVLPPARLSTRSLCVRGKRRSADRRG